MNSALLISTAVLALAVGSFINVLIYRLPLQLGLVWPNSQCPECHTAILWRDNIPLLGWLHRRGRCRACHGWISLRYPIVEAASAMAAVIVVLEFGFGPAGLSALVLSAWLLLLAGIDQDTRFLPDCLTISGLWVGLLLSTLYLHTSPTEAITGAAGGYLLLATLNAGYRGLRGRDGMGGGDFKLLAMLGAWLGLSALPMILLIAAVAGSLWALAALVRGQININDALPFGPWLAMAGWITLVWGHDWPIF